MTCNYVNCEVKKRGTCVSELRYKTCEIYRQTTKYQCQSVNCGKVFVDISPVKCIYCGSSAIITVPSEDEK